MKKKSLFLSSLKICPLSHTFVLIFLASTALYALPSPYLFPLSALTDTSIQLTWRNNSIQYDKIIIKRSLDSSSGYTVVDSVSGKTQTYVDISLMPFTRYYYCLIAFGIGETSDNSNIDSATTLKAVLYAPVLTGLIWDSINTKVVLKFEDKSRNEIRFDIFRSVNYGQSILISQIFSAIPATRAIITWNDTSITANNWYAYHVVAVNADTSAQSTSSNIYALTISHSQLKYTFTKRGELPVNYGTWSALWGDSLYLSESIAPPNSYTIINLSNSEQPTFSGYTDSLFLMALPLQSMIPLYLRFKAYNNYDTTAQYTYHEMEPVWRFNINKQGNKIIMTKNNSIFLLEISNDSINVLDSLNFTDSLQRAAVYYMNDSTAFIKGNWIGTGPLIFFETSFLHNTFSRESYSHWPQLSFSDHMFLSGFYDKQLYCIEIDSIGSGAERRYLWKIAYNLNPSMPILCPVGPITPKPGRQVSFGATNLFLSPFVELFIPYGYNMGAFDIRNPNLFDDIESLNSSKPWLYPSSEGKIRNIFIDSLKSRILLLTQNRLIIYSYSPDTSTSIKKGYVKNDCIPVTMRIQDIRSSSFIRIFINSFNRESANPRLFLFSAQGKLVRQIRIGFEKTGHRVAFIDKQSIGQGIFYLCLDNGKDGKVFKALPIFR